MDYTTTKQTVIFELPLSDYFGKTTKRRYNQETKKIELSQNWINSIQDWEEALFDNFESNYSYITIAKQGQYYNLIDAEKYLIDKGYKQSEIDLFRDTLEDDQRKALADSFDSSYQSEYSQKLYKMIMKQANKDLKDNLDIPFKILDDITDKEFQSLKTDQEYIRVEILKADIKKALKENKETPLAEEQDFKDGSYIDIFHDYYLDFSLTEVNQEYIDYYNSLCDSDDWLDYFQWNNEIIGTIDQYRIDEAAKINNLERASLELKTSIDSINSYIDQYITKEPEKTKITRQIKALKSVIKNAA